MGIEIDQLDLYQRIAKKLVKSNIYVETRVLYCNSTEVQKNREINVGHLYQRLTRSTRGFSIFDQLTFQEILKRDFKF